MVVPLYRKEDWLPIFTGLPVFDPGDAPLLFVSPHPDDETLAAGGLLASQRQRGIPVTLAAVTDGERAYGEDSGMAEIRTREQTLAAQHLGIPAHHIVRLHLTDSDVSAQQTRLTELLLPHISASTHLLAPWPRDFHPDHEACGKAAQEIARRIGCRLTFYFFWTWHRGTPSLLRDFRLQAFPLTADQQQAKAEAVALHRSQLQHPSGDPILHEVHLWPAQLAFEVYLPA